jgi:hypothetical protein
MKIGPSPCCAGAYGSMSGRWRIVLVVAAVLLALGAVITTQPSPNAPPVTVVRESITVEEESPRAVVSKLVGTYSVQASDMRDQISLLVTGRDRSPVSLDRLDTRASYAPRRGSRRAIALTPMNDHLMAAIDPSRAGTLTVALAAEGVRQELTFELPFSVP